MNNKRIIPVIIIKNGLVVQSYNFNQYLPIGKPKYIIEYLSSWDCDEIVVLDISASKEARHVNLSLISELSKNISIPLTVGGGITGPDVAEMYFKNGADKISVNSLFTRKRFAEINAISEEYGSQATVLSLDFIEDEKLIHSLYDYKRGLNLNQPVRAVIDEIRDNLEIGELLVNSVDRDGSKKGYDLGLFQTISGLVNKPVLAVGGADNLDHFLSILNINNVTGLCASNVFMHSEHSVEVFRSGINKIDIILRPNNYFSYE